MGYDGHRRGKGSKVHVAVTAESLPLSVVVGPGMSTTGKYERLASTFLAFLPEGVAMSSNRIFATRNSYESLSIKQEIVT